MKIQKGKIRKPARVVIYGPEGVGKSTLAAKFPKPLFIDIEGGTSRLDVDRVDPQGSYSIVLQFVEELKKDTQGYKTIVFDSADWMDRAITAHLCMREGKETLAEFNYGKGYQLQGMIWQQFLDILSTLQKKTGVNIVFCAHSSWKKIEVVGENGNYDHAEMKMTKQSGPILKEWSDFLFFMKFDISIMTDSSGKPKATGGQRVIYTANNLYFDAKSREKLPEKIRLTEEGEKVIFDAIFNAIPAKQESAAKPVEPETEKPQETPQEAPQQPPQEDQPKLIPISSIGANHNKLCDLMILNGITDADMNKVIVAKKMYPDGTPMANWSEEQCGRLVANWNKIVEWIKSAK